MANSVSAPPESTTFCRFSAESPRSQYVVYRHGSMTVCLSHKILPSSPSQLRRQFNIQPCGTAKQVYFAFIYIAEKLTANANIRA